MSQVCQVPSFAESLIIDLLHTMDPDITWETEYCWAFKLIEGLSSLGEKAVDEKGDKELYSLFSYRHL